MAVLAVVVLVTGCSGEDEAAEQAKADYLKRAEAVCSQANTEEKALARPTGVTTLTPYATRLVAIADRSATELAAIDPPTRDRAALDEHVFRPLQEQLGVGKQWLAQVHAADKAKDQVALMQLFADPPLQPKADLRWMKRYGFSSCVDAADPTS
jgi:hypothetical protein